MLKTADSRVTEMQRSILTSVGMLGSLALLVTGCAYGELKQVLRAQVASETNCADVSVEQQSLSQPGHKPGQYRVKGCGVDRVYECPKDEGLVSYNSKVCSYVDAHAAKPPEPPVPAAEASPDEPMDAPPAEPGPAEDSAEPPM